MKTILSVQQGSPVKTIAVLEDITPSQDITPSLSRALGRLGVKLLRTPVIAPHEEIASNAEEVRLIEVRPSDDRRFTVRFQPDGGPRASVQ